jgi:hypothetical protein
MAAGRPGTGDELGHGSAMASILLSKGVDISLYSATVFERRLVCSARQVAAALDWLLLQKVSMVNMSFGLREDRDCLRQSCARAVAAGVILIAASPARGEGVFPARLPGVIRATGDARCSPAEISALATTQADFGACVRSADTGIAGASVGCAHLSAFAAVFLARYPQGNAGELRSWLEAQASYRGPERRDDTS